MTNAVLDLAMLLLQEAAAHLSKETPSKNAEAIHRRSKRDPRPPPEGFLPGAAAQRLKSQTASPQEPHLQVEESNKGKEQQPGVSETAEMPSSLEELAMEAIGQIEAGGERVEGTQAAQIEDRTWPRGGEQLREEREAEQEKAERQKPEEGQKGEAGGEIQQPGGAADSDSDSQSWHSIQGDRVEQEIASGPPKPPQLVTAQALEAIFAQAARRASNAAREKTLRQALEAKDTDLSPRAREKVLPRNGEAQGRAVPASLQKGYLWSPDQAGAFPSSLECEVKTFPSVPKSCMSKNSAQA